jgi:hypothetical protein
MNTPKTLFKPLLTALLAVCLLATGNPSPAQPLDVKHKPANEQNILLALLLDTSNSMDGLIDQAKSQLWKIVNELAAAKCGDGSKPNIKIALYEYGNSRLQFSDGYIRQVTPFTGDLDLLSEKLFSLTTNGGDEYCGQVINTSLNQLAWTNSDADLKIIFIAGNEPFTQGRVPYRVACSLAKEKGVVVNTIFCGAFDEGIGTDWKSGADLTGGTYMSIEQNRRTVYVPTPYDDKINAMNDQLNNTYVYYGKSGASKKELQTAQDKNAVSYGLSNKVERSVSKSSHAYKNSSWDMVDAAKDDEKVLRETKEEDLPKEMKGMNAEQRKVYIKQKAEERQKIQNEIQSLNRMRQDYIAKNTPKESQDNMLDGAMIKSIKEQAKTKRLIWK